MNHTSGIAILQAESVPVQAGAFYCPSVGFSIPAETCAFRRARAAAGAAHQCVGSACAALPKPPEPVKRKVYPICLGWGRESCTKRVYYGSDRCRRHENQRIAATRAPKRVVDPRSKCGHAISKRNKSGYCRPCNVKRFSPFIPGNPGYEQRAALLAKSIATNKAKAEARRKKGGVR